MNLQCSTKKSCDLVTFEASPVIFFLNVIQRILMSHFDIAAVWPYVTFQSPKGALSQNEESEVRASWFSLQPSGR